MNHNTDLYIVNVLCQLSKKGRAFLTIEDYIEAIYVKRYFRKQGFLCDVDGNNLEIYLG